MQFQDLENLVLWRMRQRGVNFGGAPQNLAGDQNPPTLVQMLLNQKYGEFVARTYGAGLTPIKVSFPTVANALAYSLRPIPPNGATTNPSALRVLEATYTPAGGAEYPIELCSTQKFKAVTGDYVRRLSWFGPRAYYAARLYRKAQLDVAPGAATAGDTISLTIVPDVENAPAGLACASGGPMVNPTDVPLLLPQYHEALVEGVIATAGDAVDMGAKVAYANQRWEAFIAAAKDEASIEDGGEPTIPVDRFDAHSAPLYVE